MNPFELWANTQRQVAAQDQANKNATRAAAQAAGDPRSAFVRDLIDRRLRSQGIDPNENFGSGGYVPGQFNPFEKGANPFSPGQVTSRRDAVLRQYGDELLPKEGERADDYHARLKRSGFALSDDGSELNELLGNEEYRKLFASNPEQVAASKAEAEQKAGQSQIDEFYANIMKPLDINDPDVQTSMKVAEQVAARQAKLRGIQGGVVASEAGRSAGDAATNTLASKTQYRQGLGLQALGLKSNVQQGLANLAEQKYQFDAQGRAAAAEADYQNRQGVGQSIGAIGGGVIGGIGGFVAGGPMGAAAGISGGAALGAGIGGNLAGGRNSTYTPRRGGGGFRGI